MKKFWMVLVLVLAVLFSTCILAAEEEPVSVDPDQWKSPVKDVLSTNKIELQDIELANKTYYTFYVSFPKSLAIENEAWFDKTVRAIAAANKFQSFKMEDSDNEIVVQVECKSGAVTQIIYNESKTYFADLKALEVKRKEFAAAVLKAVPELEGLSQKLAARQSKLDFVIAQQPIADGADKYEKDYYVIGIVEVKGEDVNDIDECLINKDGKEILWLDAETDKYLSVADWRKKIQTAPYWNI